MNRWRAQVVRSIVVALSLGAVAAGAQPTKLGAIDFFGYKGLDVAAVRAALPFREGDTFPPANVKSSDDLKRQVNQRVRQVIGRDPTDVSFVCCNDRQAWMAYIGLPGESYQPLTWNPAPSGDVRLTTVAVTLQKAVDDSLMTAIMNGQAAEDDSEGYALSKEPAARKAQLAVRDYALQNEPLLLRVLASSSDTEHRATAAAMVGYARQSGEQIDALVRASLDPYEGVRNNAVRALGVLARARPELAQRIPAEPFTRLLRSGTWLDHNKGSLLLDALTRRRDPRVLAQLRASTLDSLLEMGRWRSIGHASPALSILGRIAGMDEDRLHTFISNGKVEDILGAFSR
jgi:hypothetical protein